MPVFEVEQDGKTYEVEASSLEEASKPIPPEIPNVLDDPLGALTGRAKKIVKENLIPEQGKFPPILGKGPLSALFEFAGLPMDYANRAVAEGGSKLAGKMLPEKYTPSADTIEKGLNVAEQGLSLMAPELSRTTPVKAMPSAGKQIKQALTRDNMTVQQAKAAAKVSIEPNTTLADVGGENVRGLIERIAQTPGEGRTLIVPFMEKRQKEQATRLIEDLKTLTGSNVSALQAIDDTLQARSNLGNPLYKQAFEDGDKVIWSPVLETISASPHVRKAMQAAVDDWQTSAIADKYGAMNPGATIGHNSGILSFLHGKVPVFPNLQFWQYTKEAIDRMIKAEKDNDGTFSKLGRNLIVIKNDMVKELDDAVGTYKMARDVWSGSQSHLNAIDFGKDILSSNKLSSEEIISDFNKLSSVDKQGAREGFVSSVFERMEANSANLADHTKILRSPKMQRVVATMMPTPEAAEKWAKRLEFEMHSSKLVGQALSGSPTYRRFAEQLDATSLANDLLWEMVKGGSVPTPTTLWNIFGKTADKFRRNFMSKTDKEIARISLDPKAMNRLKMLLTPDAQRAKYTPAQPLPSVAQPFIQALVGDNTKQTMPWLP